MRRIFIALSLLLVSFSVALAQDDLLDLLDSEQEEPDTKVEATFKGQRLINGHTVQTRKKGELEFDVHGQPVLLYDKNGLPIDLNGRRVNRKGYLTDNDGNLLNDENRVTIVNEELSSDEELPELIPTEKTAPKKMLQDEEDEQLMKKIEAHAE